MEQKQVSSGTKKLLLKYQRDELMGYEIYRKMSRREKHPKNKTILQSIAQDELDHAHTWQQYTGQDVKVNRLMVFGYTLISFLLGYTFVVKLMERGEYRTTRAYQALVNEIPEAESIIAQEQAHEAILDDMLDEERLQYVGAMVLGLNDALVELTGTIAGLTFALGNTHLVALSGIITGVSATLSMAASNYLAERANGNSNALKSSMYTGVAYMVTVVLLVMPYLLFPADQVLMALVVMLCIVVLIIFVFNYYISVAKTQPFKKRFTEMACISLGVALISFVIGLLVKRFLGIDI